MRYLDFMTPVCVDSTLGNSVKGEFNSVGENSVQLCANPCSTFYDSLAYAGLFHFNRGSHVPVSQTPFGAEFSDKYHVFPLSMMGHCSHAASLDKALCPHMIHLNQV